MRNPSLSHSPPTVTVTEIAPRSLLAPTETAGGWDWVVYSPTNGNTVNVDNGWVDNAFDTQRRRGLAVTARTNWT